MSRVQAIDPKTATGAAKPLLDAVQAQLGITPNFIRVLANSPKALEGFLGLYGATAGFAVDKATQERIALAIAEGNSCQYCVSAHTAIGRHAGLSNGEIVEIISVVALNIFTNIIGKATRVEIDFPKVALLDLPVRAAA
jgi:AhpD family alkylhydroperoxidase